jgi:ABC transporter DrrB family efflux protein
VTVVAPPRTASYLTTVGTIALRTTFKILRTPQIIGISIVQSVVFLLMFRYVLGGAIVVEGDVSYVEFLIPGFVVSGLLFTAGGSAVAVAEDAASGIYDRFRSLPIADSAVLIGRCIADAALMVIVALITLGVGFIIGFSLGGSVLDFLAAVGLIIVYALAFAGIFVWIGLISGSAQAAQGLGILAVPFSFVSSAFVPVESMPGVLEAIATWQPLTFMVNAWRGLLVGDAATATFEHSLEFYVVGSIVWSVGLALAVAPLALWTYRRR